MKVISLEKEIRRANALQSARDKLVRQDPSSASQDPSSAIRHLESNIERQRQEMRWLNERQDWAAINIIGMRAFMFGFAIVAVVGWFR
jgi:hypothetical protein